MVAVCSKTTLKMKAGSAIILQKENKKDKMRGIPISLRRVAADARSLALEWIFHNRTAKSRLSHHPSYPSSPLQVCQKLPTSKESNQARIPVILTCQ